MANSTKGRRGVAIDTNASDDDDAYWRENFRSRPYVDGDTPYEVYQPAYRYGKAARKRHSGKTWREVEAEIEAGWATARDDSDLDWRLARNACRDAWDRVDRFMRE
jgi:hypothetical protein